jgi:predicted dehydrogenase
VKLRIGLIGYGYWARTAYAPALKDLESVEIAAVAARSRSSRQQARHELGSQVITTGDYMSILGDEAIEAVMIALPNPLHHEVTKRAAGHGKHMFLEPPAAMTRCEVESVLETARSLGRVVQFDLELRYSPVARAIQEIVQRGDIGRPLSATVDLACNWGYGGGAFAEPTAREGFYLWLGSWYLDTLDFMLGGPELRDVQVAGIRAMNGPMLDAGHALIEYQNGAVGRFSHCLFVPRDDDSVKGTLVGESGSLDINFQDGTLIRQAPQGSVEVERHPPKEPVCGWAGMRESIESFVSAIRSGTPVIADAEVARRIHTVIFACHEADRAVRSPA